MSEFSAWANPFAPAAWTDVVRRSEALPELPITVLLHAGPPFEGAVPEPVRQAAVQALLFEGLATDRPMALALVATGAVQLVPAQDHGVVTPLAAVVSASMPLAVVGDESRQAWAPLIEGPPPALRFGTAEPEALTRMRAITVLGLERLAPLLKTRPVPLAPVIAQALARGDECHSRTGAANEALLGSFERLSADDRALLAGSSSFVLTILMAAAAWRLQSPDSPIAAVGGNGVRFGLRLRSELRWRCIAAQAPLGTRLPAHSKSPALGAIGDSAVIDFCGLGGQALGAAPALIDEWRATLPTDAVTRRDRICDPSTGLVDPDRVRQSGASPLVNLAILDATGSAGLVGRGCYAPDISLFATAAPSSTALVGHSLG